MQSGNWQSAVYVIRLSLLLRTLTASYNEYIYTQLLRSLILYVYIRTTDGTCAYIHTVQSCLKDSRRIGSLRHSFGNKLKQNQSILRQYNYGWNTDNCCLNIRGILEQKYTKDDPYKGPRPHKVQDNEMFSIYRLYSVKTPVFRLIK